MNLESSVEHHIFILRQIRTDSVVGIPILLIVAKSRSVIYSLRCILMRATYTSGDNCVGR